MRESVAAGRGAMRENWAGVGRCREHVSAITDTDPPPAQGRCPRTRARPPMPPQHTHFVPVSSSSASSSEWLSDRAERFNAEPHSSCWRESQNICFRGWQCFVFVYFAVRALFSLITPSRHNCTLFILSSVTQTLSTIIIRLFLWKFALCNSYRCEATAIRPPRDFCATFMQWCGLRPSVLGQDQSQTKNRSWSWSCRSGVVKTRPCYARRHNDLDIHSSNFSSIIYSFSILCLERHYCGDQQWRLLT